MVVTFSQCCCRCCCFASLLLAAAAIHYCLSPFLPLLSSSSSVFPFFFSFFFFLFLRSLLLPSTSYFLPLPPLSILPLLLFLPLQIASIYLCIDAWYFGTVLTGMFRCNQITEMGPVPKTVILALDGRSIYISFLNLLIAGNLIMESCGRPMHVYFANVKPLKVYCNF